MSTSVKHFRSNMIGAPTLNGVAGSLIGVLDACLVNGFNLRTIDSLAVAAGVATASVGGGHGYEPETVALIAGASPASLNGAQRILSTTTDTFTFAAPGIADQTATGTVTAKMAPAGWEKVFSGTNKAVYRSLDVTSTRLYLRVDDTAAQFARVVGYESMTDVDTGANRFPTEAQRSGGLWWCKASNATATARGWTLFGDSRTFYLKVCTHVTTNLEGGVTVMFGDIASAKSGDAYACQIVGHSSDLSASTSITTEDLGYNTNGNASYGSYIARAYTGLGQSMATIRRALGHYSPTYSGGGTSYAYPNGPNNGLLLCKLSVVEMTGPAYRGLFRGIFHIPQDCHAAFTHGMLLDGQQDLFGRKLFVSKYHYPNATTSNGMLLFDITGPWE